MTAQRDREAVASLVRSTVRIRFTLGVEAFTGRVLALADEAPDVDAPAFARRLSLDDLYLASACAAGDEGAWEELAGRHFSFLRSFARRMLSEASAADVADQVIADLWQRGKIARFSGRSSLRTWLGAVVTRASLNAMRGEPATTDVVAAASGPAVPPQLSSEPRPHADERSRLLGGVVRRALGTVDAEGRLLLLLHYEQGLTLEQMGALVGGSKASLSRRLARIRARLRERIDEIARDELGTSAGELWAGADPGRIELDLAAAIGADQREPGRDCAVQEA